MPPCGWRGQGTDSCTMCLAWRQMSSGNPRREGSKHQCRCMKSTPVPRRESLHFALLSGSVHVPTSMPTSTGLLCLSPPWKASYALRPGHHHHPYRDVMQLHRFQSFLGVISLELHSLLQEAAE